MRKLAWASSFRRAFKQRTRNNSGLQSKIFRILDLLVEDPFLPVLRTHKLSGKLDGLWPCYVEYDCRIIFEFDRDPSSREEILVLVDLGSHDEVTERCLHKQNV